MGRLNMNLYLKKLKLRYFQTNRKGKSLILDEFCATSGLTRKHVISIFNGPPLSRKDQPIPRKKYYDSEQLLIPLKAIWLATDQMCGKRLKAAMPLWLSHYERMYGLKQEVRQKLLTMSDRTIDRILQPIKNKYRKKLCGTKPGSLLRQQIPIKTDQWNEKIPGFVEADTVAHCGTSLLGNFVWSITLTDIYSGWTENAAVWNKGAHGVLKQLEIIEKKLTFKLLGFDSDNGGEFLNYHLIKYFQNRKNPIQFTRSRPYHNDKPQTPYQRLIQSEYISSLQKENMQKIFETLNPFELQQGIQKKLKNIFKYIDLKLKGRAIGI